MPIEGRTHCTMEGREETKNFMHQGPDGNGWVALDQNTIKTFCENHQKLYHQRLAEHSTKHVCAFYGNWGFTADGETRGVIFLRYEFRGILRQQRPEEVFDPTHTVGVFGHDLYKEYKKVSRQRPVHVWQRDGHGEIALDFCVG